MTTSINNSYNREAILYLLTLRSTHERAWEQGIHYEVEFVEHLDLGELRAHPDLGGLLRMAAPHLPGVRHGFVLGYDVLVNQQEIIFALATGMMVLDFRLYPPDARPVTAGRAEGIEALSSEWRGVAAFGDNLSQAEVLDLCRRALENANRLGS